MPPETEVERIEEKYHTVFELMEQLGARANTVEMREGKLYVRGEAPTPAIKNRIWDQIMAVDPIYSDLICEIAVNPRIEGEVVMPAFIDPIAAHPEEPITYVVQEGDTLASISHQFYGISDEWRKILDANRDQIDDPERLDAGTVLRIPALSPTGTERR
jgi:hypothetical protein